MGQDGRHWVPQQKELVHDIRAATRAIASQFLEHKVLIHLRFQALSLGSCTGPEMPSLLRVNRPLGTGETCTGSESHFET